MNALLEKRAEFEAKQKRLAQIMAEAKDSDGLYHMDRITLISGTNDEKRAEIQRLNEELNAVGDDYRKMLADQDALGNAAASADRFGNDLARAVNRPPHQPSAPASGGQTAQRPVLKSIGQLFTESATFREYNATARRGPAVDVDLNEDEFRAAFMGAPQATLLDEASGYAIQNVRTGLILPGALRRPVVADLIPQATTNGSAIVYMEETTTTNATATVAEGAAKPESALAFTERTSSVRKIATVLPITDELLADEPAMRGYVEARMRLFLQLVEETQLISGDGNAPNLRGMMNATNVQTQAKGADPTPDAIYKAMDLIRTGAFLEPSGVVIHPLDWQDVRLLRTVDGIYIWGNPSEAGPQRIWGLPVVVTTAATQNTAIVAAFDTAMQIFRRTGVSFAISDQNEDFFIKNKLMLRVEERLAFVIYRGAGIVKVTGI